MVSLLVLSLLLTRLAPGFLRVRGVKFVLVSAFFGVLLSVLLHLLLLALSVTLDFLGLDKLTACYCLLEVAMAATNKPKKPYCTQSPSAPSTRNVGFPQQPLQLQQPQPGGAQPERQPHPQEPQQAQQQSKNPQPMIRNKLQPTQPTPRPLQLQP